MRDDSNYQSVASQGRVTLHSLGQAWAHKSRPDRVLNPVKSALAGKRS